ncbi:uncharacterized protein LOC141628925 [Silene latifolia]|uniref:uncharacterized protein LOC141628925 n=1 Tax=Silene latifolia TaxID=37657 RepID=UPI003D77E203
MNKRCWFELLNDYKVKLQYHEGKTNLVVDTLSRKVCHAMRSVVVLLDDLHRDFQKMSLEVMLPSTLYLSAMVVEPQILHEIRVKQRDDELQEGVRVAKSKGHAKRFNDGPDDGRRFQDRWCISSYDVLKCEILKEAHSTPYSVHPGGDKMYKVLKLWLWWPNMKKEIVEFVIR